MSYPQPQPGGYQAPAPPVDRVVTGQLVGVEARTAGWMRFLILERPENQWPYKCDTKKEEVIGQAMSLIQQGVSAQVREQESTEINQHTGKPYLNRYLNSIAPMGAGQQPQQQQPQQPQPTGNATPYVSTPQTGTTQPGLSGYDRDINIMRQTASKVVAMSVDVLPEGQRNPEGMVAACEAWLAYYVYGPLRFGVQSFSTDQQGATPPEMHVPDAGPCSDCGFSGMHAVGCPQDVDDKIPF